MACRGHEVEVFEAGDGPGGKLSQFEKNGYRFDLGPSLFTMPQYVDELFHLAGEEPGRHFRYTRVPRVCHYFWEDGTRLEASAKIPEFARAATEITGVPSERIVEALRKSRRKYELTGRIFLEKSLHRLDTWLKPDVLRALLHLPSLDIFSSMDEVHRDQLDHPKLVQLFNRFATYNGSNPYRAPGLLSMIPHFEHGIGTYFPEGGMFAITDSIYRLALRKGVRFRFNRRIDRIEVRQGRAAALWQGENRHEYDAVISNMDVFFTYRRLLPDQPPPKRILRQEKSTSALIFYWGVKRQFPQLGLHNIFFSRDYRREFDHLERGEVCEDATVYVNITQKYRQQDAPAGSENWFTMINVPYDRGQEWDRIVEDTRNHTLNKLSRMLDTDISPLVECEAVLDPRTIESRTDSHLGALYGTSSNDRMAAFLRHPNFSRKIDNLYFCGGSVHPGGGIPLCLLSARIVDEIMHHDHPN